LSFLLACRPTEPPTDKNLQALLLLLRTHLAVNKSRLLQNYVTSMDKDGVPFEDFRKEPTAKTAGTRAFLVAVFSELFGLDVELWTDAPMTGISDQPAQQVKLSAHSGADTAKRVPVLLYCDSHDQWFALFEASQGEPSFVQQFLTLVFRRSATAEYS
jgi:hypothetical protein